MAKPTVLPRWATDVSADVTEPASGTKDTGYVDGGIPEAGELNWLLEHGYEWDLWLSTFESTAHEWSAPQNFTADVSFNIDASPQLNINFDTIDAKVVIIAEGGLSVNAGIDVVDGGINAAGGVVVTGSAGSPGITATGGTGNTTGGTYQGVGTGAGLLGTGGSSGGPGLSGVGGTGNGYGVKGVGGGSNGGGGQFTGTGAGRGAVAVGSSTGSSALLAMRGDSSTSGVVIEALGSIDFDSATNVAFGTAIKNKQTKGLLPRAWCVLTANGTSTPAINDSENVTSVSQATDGTWTINFSQVFAFTSYCVQVTPSITSSTNAATVQGVSKSVGSCSFGVYNANSATLLDRTAQNSAGVKVDVLFFGRQ